MLGRVGYCLLALLLAGCSITATRPVQEMSDTAAAIRAAREVQADIRAPELFRQANEWFFRSRQEYKLKNFKEAANYAHRARRFAEEAEYEALNSGATRVTAPPDPFSETGTKNTEVKPAPMAPPPPVEIPVEAYEEQQRLKEKLELEKAKQPKGSTQIINVQPSTVPPPLSNPSPAPTP